MALTSTFSDRHVERCWPLLPDFNPSGRSLGRSRQRSIVEHEGAERGDRLDKTLPLEHVQQLRYGHRLADEVLLLLVDDGHGGPRVEIEDAEDEDIRMLRFDVERFQRRRGKSFAFNVTMIWALARIAAATTWRSS